MKCLRNIGMSPLETRDDALIDVLYNVKNIAIFQEDIYIGSGEQLIVWDKYGKFKRVLSKKGNDPQSYLHFNHFMIWPNGDLSIASPIEIVTYSNSHQFINKKRCENVGYIEAITLLNDSLYIIKCMPTPEQLRYRIINHHTGAIINSYDSIINCNRYISSFTNSFERYEGHIISHGYQSNDILECTLDSSKIRYKINVDNRIPPAGFYTQEGKEGMQLIQGKRLSKYIFYSSFSLLTFATKK